MSNYFSADSIQSWTVGDKCFEAERLRKHLLRQIYHFIINVGSYSLLTNATNNILNSLTLKTIKNL